MTPARVIWQWLERRDRRDAVLAFLAMGAVGWWRGGVLEGMALGLLGAFALAIRRIDGRHYVIPDLLVLALGGLGLGRLAASWAALWPHGLALLAMLAVMLGLRQAAQRLAGQPALGLGDVKLMAVSALWLAPGQLPSFILAAALLGLAEAALTRPRPAKLAFGRHLAPALCLFAAAGAGFRL